MNRKNFIAAGILAAVFLASFAFAGGILAFWNLAAFLVVLSGTAAALFLSYPWERIQDAWNTARDAYATKATSPQEVVGKLLDMAVKARIEGPLVLEKAAENETDSFVKSAVHMLVDGYEEGEIRDTLATEMRYRMLHSEQMERVFTTMARIAPAFGVAGSVIGLIGLLMGMGDTGAVLRHIPVAFVSTLYGIILANLVFAPVAENIHMRTAAELTNKRMVLDSILAIKAEQNPYKLERKLSGFLPPEEREERAEQLRVITRRYIRRKKQEERGEVVEEQQESLEMIPQTS